MRLLRFLRHFALNCLNCLTFLTRTLNLIMSLLFPTFVLFPISACSFFDNLTVSTQHVPFSNSITHQPVPFLTSCIPITKATTSFDIVAYRKKYYGEIILSPSSSHQVIRND